MENMAVCVCVCVCLDKNESTEGEMKTGRVEKKKNNRKDTEV